MKTMTSREANQDFSRAKRESKAGPLLITERGKPANVLLSYEEYKRLTEEPESLFDALWDPASADIELELPARTISPRKTELE
jgi:prevent-host-death family protein